MNQQNNPYDIQNQQWMDNLRSISEIQHKIMTEVMQFQKEHMEGFNFVDPKENHAFFDPMNIGDSLQKLMASFQEDPKPIFESQYHLWLDTLKLWQSMQNKAAGMMTEAVIEPEKFDRRFKDDSWSQDMIFDFIKQCYLIWSKWVMNSVQQATGLDEHDRRKIEFHTKQYLDALSPSNYVFTNPVILKETIASQGQNLKKGWENLLADLKDGKLYISMTDMDAFEVGKNIATTPGKVIFQNKLIQLIQYTPMTKKAYKTPVLIMPPWINKYYILDLQEKNSLIQYLLKKGHTVFIISWANPDKSFRGYSFENYMQEGSLAGMEAVLKVTGEKQLNMVGYCIGGTLLACTMAYLAAHKQDEKVKSATYLTSMVDFSEPGELSVFIDEKQILSLEKHMSKKGFLDSHAMQTTFNMLRSNDLIWSYVVNNYLLGKDPFPFDLLYWNCDSTNMPEAMHSYYLRNMYQKNLLIEPNALTMLDTPLDLRKIKTPTFILSTKLDHIAPWETTYHVTQVYQGPVEFCLAGSGHIAGVVNPPAAEKYSHWTNDVLPTAADEWLASAKEHPGSWWDTWEKWLKAFGGAKMDARDPESGPLPVLEEAPGTFVKKK